VQQAQDLLAGIRLIDATIGGEDLQAAAVRVPCRWRVRVLENNAADSYHCQF
jgi:hypothetical protein